MRKVNSSTFSSSYVIFKYRISNSYKSFIEVSSTTILSFIISKFRTGNSTSDWFIESTYLRYNKSTTIIIIWSHITFTKCSIVIKYTISYIVIRSPYVNSTRI